MMYNLKLNNCVPIISRPAKRGLRCTNLWKTELLPSNGGIMKKIISLALCLFFFLFSLFPVAVFAVESYVTQTSMTRALLTTLQTEAPLYSEYEKESPYGKATGNLGFAQTFFYRLFQTELGGADLTQSPALMQMSHFKAGDANAASTIGAARGALRFGDVIQYGTGGYVAIVLGDCEGEIVVLDCGFGGKDRTVRMRFVTEAELTEQALRTDAGGGLYFFRSKNMPASDITLNLVAKPSALSYYLETTPTADGALLEYYSQQTGRQEIHADNKDLKIFSATKEAGEVPMIFLYGSSFTFCRLEVKNETVEELKLETPPTKLEYTTEETLDMTGAVVTAKMLDGTVVTLTEDEYTASYTFTTTGEAVVTLSYGGKSTTFFVAVKEPPVSRLSVIAPTKTQYYVGERLDLTGGSIVVDYEKEKNVSMPLLEAMLSTYDTSLVGSQTITVQYGGKTDTFTIQVLENKVASLSLISALGKQYRQGSSLDLAKIELCVTYEDGQTRTITARDCEVTINGKATSTFENAGEAEIVFSYRSVSTGTTAVKVAQDPMQTFITAAIVIVACLIGLPILVLLAIYLVRKQREKKEAQRMTPAFDTEVAQEIASFDDDDEEDVRIFDEKGGASDTVPLPKIRTGVPSIRPAEDSPTIQIPKMDTKPSEEMGHTRKIDFFDDL